MQPSTLPYGVEPNPESVLHLKNRFLLDLDTSREVFDQASKTDLYGLFYNSEHAGAIIGVAITNDNTGMPAVVFRINRKAGWQAKKYFKSLHNKFFVYRHGNVRLVIPFIVEFASTPVLCGEAIGTEPL